MKIRHRIIDQLLKWNEKFIFDRKLFRYFSHLKGMSFECVVDVGSNKGQTIDLILKLNSQCKVIGFEPNRELFDYIVEKYREQSNIQLHRLGVSDVDGEKIFYENVLDTTSSLEEVNPSSTYLKFKAQVLGIHPDEIVTAQYPVQVCTLNSFFEREELRHVDLLKIDTEGHEFACLVGLFQGGADTVVDRIQLENHNDDMYADKSLQIGELLQVNGYDLEASIKHGFGNLVELIYKKNLTT